MVNDDTNVTQKILSDDAFEVSEGERHAKTTADDIGRGVQPNQYKNKKTQVYSKTEELERGIDDELGALQNLLNEFDQLKKSDQFQEDFENGRGFVDADDFQLAEDIIEIFKDIVPRYTLIKELLYNFSEQQDTLIDIQQLAQDEGRIKEYIDEQVNLDKKRYQRMFDLFEEDIQRYHDRLEDMQEEMNSIKKTEAKKADELNDTLETLSQVLASMQQTGMQQPQYNPAQGSPYQGQQNQQPMNQGQTVQNNGTGRPQPQPQSQNIQTQQTAQNGQQPAQNQSQIPDLDQFDLNDKEKELVENYFEMKDNPEFKQKDLAEEVDLARTTVSSKLSEFEERGIIPQRQG